MLPFRFFCGNGDSSLAGLQMEMLNNSTDFVLGSIVDLSPFSPKKRKGNMSRTRSRPSTTIDTIYDCHNRNRKSYQSSNVNAKSLRNNFRFFAKILCKTGHIFSQGFVVRCFKVGLAQRL